MERRGVTVECWQEIPGQARDEGISLLSLLLSFRPPSRNLIRVIRRRSRIKPGMRGIKSSMKEIIKQP